MRNAACILSLSLLLSVPAMAQKFVADDWEAKPQMHQVDTDFARAEAVVIDQSVKIEVVKEGQQSYIYRTLHRTVKVLDEKGIEGFNKMSFPASESVELITLKARTILPDGKIYEVTKDKMKTSKNEEDGSSELAFAMEGVEKGAEIELLYCYKRPVSLFGSETYQFSVPVMHAGFKIISPTSIIYEGKGYNGFPNTHDTLLDDRRITTADKWHIPALRSETYAFYDLNRMRVDYKVSYLPEDKPNVRMFTWQDLVRRMYDNYYSVSEKETKAVKRYLDDIGVKESDAEADKIAKIENAIKNGIVYYREIADPNAWKLDVIISKKSATETGLNRLFANCFKQAGVTCELGVISNRYQSLFDSEFENWNLMEDFVIYFPGTKKFLFPTGAYYRYPVVPASMLTNKGVFCKIASLGEVSSAIADIRTITPLPYTESSHNIDAKITFNADMDAKTDLTYSFNGYSAVGVREVALLLPKDKMKEFVRSVVSICDKPENLISYTTANEAFENYNTGTPLQITATVNTPQLVEKAGNKYILKIGDVIGRQEELYQDKERRLPIDMSYPHSLNRTIRVTLPAGYKVLNPETINIDAELKDKDGKATSAFHSGYKMEGNDLVVNITEFYAQLHYEIADYETFRKVINASADFNKVNLLLSDK